jgi:hypothetical protein
MKKIALGVVLCLSLFPRLGAASAGDAVSATRATDIGARNTGGVVGVPQCSPPDCDDGNPCTKDSCNCNIATAPACFCEHAPIPGCCTGDAECPDPNPASKCEEGRCDIPAGAKSGTCLSYGIFCPDTDPADCKFPQCNPSTGACEDKPIANCPPPPPCPPPTPPPSECKADADCEKDGDRCTAPHCLLMVADGMCPDGKRWGYTTGKCAPETPIPGCHECPKCPEPPPPPKVDCTLIGDPKIQKCCTEVYDKYGKFLFLNIALDKCVDDGDTNGCNEFIKALGDISITDSIICCQFINNSICESGSCIQNCQKIVNNCPGGGTGGTTGGPPTAPAAVGSCEVKCKDVDCSIAINTEGQGVGWIVSYTPPPDVGPVATAVLKQVEGEVPLTPEEPAPSGSNALSIKTITDPSSLSPFVVYTRKPTTYQGTYLPKFKVTVQLNDLSDHELASLTCGNDTALEMKGGHGCGCFLGAGPWEFGANALLVSFLGLPLLISRRRS